VAPTKIDPCSGALIYCFQELDHENAKNVQNIIPGEVKIWYKFRRSFLEADDNFDDSDEFNKDQRIIEARKVFTQIYQYMNERDAAIGYVITDYELICVRRIRKERYGIRYGVLDISPSIPLSIEQGQLNAKLTLFYIHLKYGVLEPRLGLMPRTPKPPKWRGLVKDLRCARILRNSVQSRDYNLRGGRVQREQLNLDDKRESMYEDDN